MNKKQVTKKNEQEFSKFLSFILRHKPEEIGLTLEDNGWVNVSELLNAINHPNSSKWSLSLDMLKQIVANDNKQRYSFNKSKTKIKANQGHSIKGLKIEFTEVTNIPEYLYHGTSTENSKKIIESGVLKPMSRQMVHLSKDVETATNVGKRHGKHVIFKVEAKRAQQSGIKFYLSDNGVYLVESISTDYIKLETD